MPADKDHLDENDIALLGFVIERLQRTIHTTARLFATMVAASMSAVEPDEATVAILGRQVMESLACLVADGILVAMASTTPDTTLLDVIHAQREHYDETISHLRKEAPNEREMMIGFLTRMANIAPDILPTIKTVIAKGYVAQQSNALVTDDGSDEDEALINYMLTMLRMWKPGGQRLDD